MLETALDKEGLIYYDGKSKEYIEEKITALDSKKIDKTTVATSSTLGLVKSGTDITVDSSGNVSIKNNSHEHTVSNISDLTATASELNVLDGITASTTELNYVDGVTSNIQTQLNAKAPLASPTLTGTPKAPTASAGTNTTQIATTAFVQTAVSNLVDSAPETLNTLNELSSALGDDPNFATTVATQPGNKVDKVSGKGLSTNDYTTADKTKLGGIATGAEVNQNAFSNVVVGSTTISADSKTDSLTLAAGSNVTITPDATNDKITISSSHPTISKSTNTTSTASPSAGGTFTAIDSVKTDSNGHVTTVNTKTVTLPSTSVTVDSALSSTSTNPVQNKVVNTALTSKAPKSHASTATTYGAGTASNYGHVKLSDSYTTSAGAASASVAASSKAVYDCYTALNSNLTKVFRTSITFDSYASMSFCRGDGRYINLYIPGVYLATATTSLKISGTISIVFSDKSTYRLSSPTAKQYKWGVLINSATPGLGLIGVAVFTTTFSITT